jgi:hypothetical protein
VAGLHFSDISRFAYRFGRTSLPLPFYSQAGGSFFRPSRHRSVAFGLYVQ